MNKFVGLGVLAVLIFIIAVYWISTSDVTTPTTYTSNFVAPTSTLAQLEVEQNRKNFLFEKQSECNNICEKLYLKEVSQLSKNTVLNPKYAYNDAQNACYYSGGWLDIDEDVFTQRVLNCQTNEEVLTYMTVGGEVFTGFCDTCVDSRIKYNAKEKELMGR